MLIFIDTPQNSPYKPLKLPAGAIRGRNPNNPQSNNNGTGAIPRTRKLSNSSMASDISFRLPTWDAGSVSMSRKKYSTNDSRLTEATACVCPYYIPTRNT